MTLEKKSHDERPKFQLQQHIFTQVRSDERMSNHERPTGYGGDKMDG